MEVWQIVLLIVGSGLLLWALMEFVVAYFVYRHLLVRTRPEKWSRECSIKDDDEQKAMYEVSEEWLLSYHHLMQEVKIENEGYALVGEYVDFGFDRSVIIISGRTEGCHYSYYFAEPYRLAGYNVLVIDNRCHGLSDGKYNALGLKEYTDILAWGRFLHENHHQNEIVLHGICIGSATALYALVSPNCPAYMVGMAADGMYVHFKESLVNHMIEQKRRLFPGKDLIPLWFRICTGKNMVKGGPIHVIDQLKKPILFIYSKEDKYSVPEKAQILFDACKAPGKRLAWFPRGAHSKVRINNKEAYDQTVIQFLKETFHR